MSFFTDCSYSLNILLWLCSGTRDLNFWLYITTVCGETAKSLLRLFSQSLLSLLALALRPEIFLLVDFLDFFFRI